MEKIRTDLETIKTKISQVAKEVNIKIRKGIEWSVNNPELVVTYIGVATAFLHSTRSIVVSHRVAAERKRIDQTYYDPSTGFHWDLRRKATNADRAEILRRKALGQDTYSILHDMRLIK